MCVCIYIYIYIYIHTCINTFVYLYIYPPICVHIYKYIKTNDTRHGILADVLSLQRWNDRAASMHKTRVSNLRQHKFIGICLHMINNKHLWMLIDRVLRQQSQRQPPIYIWPFNMYTFDINGVFSTVENTSHVIIILFQQSSVCKRHMKRPVMNSL